MKDSVFKLLQDRYFLNSEKKWEDIADRVSFIYPDLKENILNLEFIPSSPTLFNLNTKDERKGTLSSCFIVDVKDDMSSIMDTAKDIALITKASGGVGVDISSLRGSTEFVKSIGNRKSSGPLPFINIYNSILDGVQQGGARRGAGMVMLNIDHPDILNFIKAKNENGKFERFNFSIRVSNEFYKSLEKEPDSIWEIKEVTTGEKKPLIDENGNSITVKQLWDLIVNNAWNKAEPGIFNSDIAFERCTVTNVNSKVSSNPCLRDTVKVITKSGLRELKDINIGDTIWSKEGWTKVLNKFETGEKEVFEYITSFGIFESTKNHEIESNGVKVEVDKADSIDVLTNKYTKVEKFNNNLIMDGLVLGDGSVHKASNNLVYLCIGTKDQDYFNSEIKDLLLKNRETSFSSGWEVATSINYQELPKTYNRKIPDRFFVLNTTDIASLLRGLFSANGSICGDRVTYKTASLNMIKDIQLLLNLVGIRSYYTTNTPKCVSFRNGDYICKKSYDLNITTDNVKFFNSIGFLQKYKMEKLKDLITNKSFSTKIKSAKIKEKKSLGVHKVWDITVDNKSHTFWCNGFSISNCQEYTNIPYSSCNLGSINLSKLIDDKGNFNWIKFEIIIRNATRYLDSIIDNNEFPLKKIKDITLKIRPIGLGFMGLAHALFKMEIPYNSKKALIFTENMNKFLTVVSMDESVNIAKEMGSYDAYDYDLFMKANFRFFKDQEFELFDVNKLKAKIKKYGVRNSCFTSIAPTGSISFIAESSSGIEPVFALTFARKIEKLNKQYDYVYITDPIFEDYLNKNFDEESKMQILKDVSENNGSCQICNLIPNKYKKIFITAGDLSPKEHLEMLSVSANNTSLSVSKTINLPKTATKEEVSEVYIEAYKKGIIGVTIYRDGCREGILVHGSSTRENRPEIFNHYHAPKRPKELPCEIYHATYKGEKWIAFIGLLEGKPYEIFCGKNTEEVELSLSIECGIIKKVGSGHYSFIYDNSVVIENINKTFHNDDNDDFARSVSLSLRSGIHLNHIVDTLNKSKGDITKFSKVLSRILKKYIKDGEESTLKCDKCRSKLVYIEGCIKCSNPECGFSKCG